MNAFTPNDNQICYTVLYKQMKVFKKGLQFLK